MEEFVANNMEVSMTRILIIDDDVQILKMLKRALEGEDYEVIEAADGNQGLKLYREDPTDLVITDIIMPEKEGVELIMELRNESPDVKIIAISGGGRLDPAQHLRIAKAAGAQYAFIKPVERKELLQAVGELLK